MKRWALLLALLSLVALGAACGSDDDDGGAVSDGGGTSSGKAKAPPVYTITAKEEGKSYSFDVPDDIKGGVVTLKLVSDAGNKEPHDFQLVKLDGHDTESLVSEVSDDSKPVPEWIQDASGVGTVAPGQTATATVRLDTNEEYAFFCTESSDDNGAHSTHGMSGSFTTGDDSGAEMPTSAATVGAKEYGFDISGLKAGENTITFTNNGKMLHHLLLLPFAEGATFDAVKKALTSEGDSEGPPPVQFEKGHFTAVAGPGKTIQYTANLTPGKYVAVCFMPDKGTSGPPHVVKGMLQEVDIS